MKAEELYKLIDEKELEPIWEGPLDTWRWGVVRDEVYEIEGRFWRISYRDGSGDNGVNELAEGYCGDPWEVEPKEEIITRTIYVDKK